MLRISGFPCFLFTFTSLFISCQDASLSKSTHPIYKAVDSLNQTSQFYFDVPLDKAHQPDLLYRESMSADRILKIPQFNPSEEDLFVSISSDFDGSGNRQ